METEKSGESIESRVDARTGPWRRLGSAPLWFAGGVIVALLIPGTPSLTQQDVSDIVLRQIENNPEVIVKSVNAFMEKDNVRRANAADELVFSKKADIARAPNHPYVGNPNGKVTLVYFFDSNCIYCKKMDPMLRRIVSENPDVKVVHREIPILQQTSHLAAQVGNMVWLEHPDDYRNLHDKFLSHQGNLSDEDIEGYLTLVVGAETAKSILDRVDDDGDETSNNANNRVQENLGIAKSAGITGTPFVYVLQGDGLIRGAGDDTYERLKSLIDKARTAG